MAGESVGNAYLNVVPKIDGDAKSLGDSFGKKFTGGAKSAFSAGAVALGNIMANVATSAASAIGDTFAEAFWDYADYEQLIGGVDTLFKEASATVQENARNAFKTAGLSANEYMENVTSFSASLIQSLDGDTVKAAQVADRAMVDMSDNANKMGTDMQSITNAYQGFAKQNYTMLDNLKLGYGGTKAEMERLLEDAGKIANTEFNIDSYADVIEAIHVMQESMDITGTTMEEGSTTISGSINQLQGAWTNFLTALGDGGQTMDMDKAIQDLKDSLKAVADNVLPLIQRIGDTISQELPPAIEAALELVVSTADEWVPQFMDFGGRIGLAIVSGLANGLTPFMDELNAGVEDGLNAVGDGISGFAEGVGDAMSELLSGAQHDLDAMGTAFGEVKDTIGTALSGAVTNVTTGARGIMDGISRGISSIPGRVKGVFDRVKSAISEPIDKAKTLVSGAIDHIKGLFPLSIGKIFSNIQLPHISVSGGSPPFGIGGKGSLPSFSVDWYAKGGIADGATLIGVGEAGPEAIVPLQGEYMRPFARAIAQEMGGAGITINLNYDASDDANDMLRDITSGIRQLRAAGAI